MSKSLSYRGYHGRVEYDCNDRMVYGEVINILDVIAFEGRTAEEHEQSFHEAVDAYLQLCIEGGTEPEKPLSGSLLSLDD